MKENPSAEVGRWAGGGLVVLVGGGGKERNRARARGKLTNPIMTRIMIVCSRYSHLTSVSLALPPSLSLSVFFLIFVKKLNSTPTHSLPSLFTPRLSPSSVPVKASKLCGLLRVATEEIWALIKS